MSFVVQCLLFSTSIFFVEFIYSIIFDFFINYYNTIYLFGIDWNLFIKLNIMSMIMSSDVDSEEEVSNLWNYQF